MLGLPILVTIEILSKELAGGLGAVYTPSLLRLVGDFVRSVSEPDLFPNSCVALPVVVTGAPNVNNPPDCVVALVEIAFEGCPPLNEKPPAVDLGAAELPNTAGKERVKKIIYLIYQCLLIAQLTKTVKL